MRRGATRAGALAALLLPALAALRIWAPLLENYFFADDFLHLFDLTTLRTSAFLTQLWGGHLYVVRNGVFLATYEVFGPDPRPFFTSMLVTHLVNVLLLGWILRRLGGGLVLACAGAVLWATCPLLEGALGWYSVYGQVLLTTLVLVVVASFLGRVRSAPTILTPGAALGWGALLVLGGGCFGTGLGIAAAFPLAVLLALPPSERSPRAIGVLALAAAALLVVYAVLRVRTPELDARLSGTSMLRHLPATLALLGHLFAAGAWGLLDGFPSAGEYPSLAATVVAAGTLLTVVAAVLVAGKRRRSELAALALLVLAAYGTVAAGRGALIESVKLSLAGAAAWPRYHYLPLALLTLLGTSSLAALGDRSTVAGHVVRAIAAAVIVLRVGCVFLYPLAIDHHDAERTETAAVLGAIHDAVAATPPGGVAWIENRPFRAAALPGLFPGSAGVFVIWFPGDALDGRPVRFSSSENQWSLAQERGGRIARIVVRR